MHQDAGPQQQQPHRVHPDGPQRSRVVVVSAHAAVSSSVFTCVMSTCIWAETLTVGVSACASRVVPDRGVRSGVCRDRYLSLNDNQLSGTVPATLTAVFTPASPSFSHNCIEGCSGQYLGCAMRSCLVDLFVATNGASWLYNSNWLTTASPCDWFGVVCDSSVNVTYVATP